MDAFVGKVTLEEFKIFHGLDRELYTILIRDLSRNPSESLQVMGFWHWLERGGFRNLVSRILSLDTHLINRACDEAVICLQVIMATHHLPPTPPPDNSPIPLTCCLLKIEAPFLQFLSENRLVVFHGVQNLVSDICIPALSDIMELARQGSITPVPSPTRAGLIPLNTPSPGPRTVLGPIGPPSPVRALTLEDLAARGLSGLKVADGDSGGPPAGEAGLPKFSRTMFVTFSKGYPVTEAEVRDFFVRLFGNCIESLYMQEVEPEEQALYARIVFMHPSYIHFILNGEPKAKFSINGKHVWMRQFVPRNGNVGPSACLNHQFF
ncbi:Unknown protein [Striga hermonthica]|uniref:Uncharacterized protein n=1 Tax=Striga hermonthica TaxID=68872 RepID=A0A9N7NJZ3_STRHE|nr:Unknown protein [Striga hermonthica]